jgi:hypothetical protein
MERLRPIITTTARQPWKTLISTMSSPPGVLEVEGMAQILDAIIK